MTEPYPGAFSYLGQRKLTIWRSRPLDLVHNKLPGTVLSTAPLTVACGEGRWRLLRGKVRPVCMSKDRLAQEMGIVTDVRLGNKPSNTLKRRTRVLILG